MGFVVTWFAFWKNEMMENTNEPFNKIRRKDRAKDDAWIRVFLKRAAYGSLATSVDSQPFINTRLFVFDEAANVIYLHGAKAGRTLANIEINSRVCFSATKMGRLLPADEAIEVSVEFSSVVVFGRVSVVTNEEEALHSLDILMKKYFPHLQSGKDYRPPEPKDLKITAVFRVDIESWSGKQKKASDDFPGAFYYENLNRGT